VTEATGGRSAATDDRNATAVVIIPKKKNDSTDGFENWPERWNNQQRRDSR
jgi:hypothetical protein